VTRREFLRVVFLSPFALRYARDLWAHSFKEALHYEGLEERKVLCKLCPRACVLGEGQLGFCRARKNIGGRLYSLGYASPCAIHVDPIEKKPFFHVLPGTTSLSIASAGCNLRCRFCQNWQISQFSPLETDNIHAPPERLVSWAIKEGSRSLAYTYTEPTNFYEFMLDTSRLAKAKGLFNVAHSNGYINPGPLRELLKYMDAINIDLKAFDRAFYREICEAELSPVLETLKTIRAQKVWLEITNLVIPRRNDNIESIRYMCRWIVRNLGPETPLHFSRFFPTYKMTGLPPTPVSTLERARAAAIEAGLRYVYIGNVPGHPGESTFCPSCGRLIVKRSGYSILSFDIRRGACRFCGRRIEGIWEG